GVQRNLKLLRVPDLLLGFRCKASKKALEQLGRLEKELKVAFSFIEGFDERLKAADIKGGKVLTLELDGKLLPLENADLSDFERNNGEFKPLLDHLKGMKMAVAVAVKGEYILISIGEKSTELGRFAAGAEPPLSSRDEMKPIIKAGDT